MAYCAKSCNYCTIFEGRNPVKGVNVDDKGHDLRKKKGLKMNSNVWKGVTNGVIGMVDGLNQGLNYINVGQDRSNFYGGQANRKCRDKDQSNVCKSYVDQGHCKSNYEYMAENCAKSCSLCEGTKGNFYSSLAVKNY